MRVKPNESSQICKWQTGADKLFKGQTRMLLYKNSAPTRMRAMNSGELALHTTC